MNSSGDDPGKAQRLAADPHVSAWVDASAGSGKTKVLTDRVLSLLLDGARPHSILCLTFTKAAAGEMANRVNRRLAAWARADDQALADELNKLIGADADPDMMARARRLFSMVQDAPGGLRFDTMHAFCQGVLQRFPLEAGISPHFSVLDERDRRLLLLEARDALVRAVIANPDTALADAWGRVIGRVTEGSFSSLMGEIAANALALRQADPASVANSLGIAAGASAEAVIGAAARDSAFDRDGLAAASEIMLADRRKTVAKAGAAIAAWLRTPAQSRDWGAYRDVLLTKAGTPRKMPDLKGHADAQQVFDAELERVLTVAADLAKVESLTNTTALLTVAGDLLARYERSKRVRSLLDYDDLIQAAGRLLVDPGAAWVHYKLDRGIDHVLVDEAQDTSREQWQVIEGLIADFFAGDSASDQHRTFFAVGDPKQSIYSFQGADPAAFNEYRQRFAGQASGGEAGWRDVPLTVSFRSAAPVLRLVDAVFSDAAALGVSQDRISHTAHRAGECGRVEIWPLVEEKSAEEFDHWAIPREYAFAASAEERTARLVAGRVRMLVDSGEHLDATGAAIRPRDIMVLVRRRRRFGAALVAALKGEGVPVAGVDRMSLARQLVVKDLIAFGEFLLMPSDDLTLAAVLKGPFFAWDDDRLFRIAYGRAASLWHALCHSPHEEDRRDASVLTGWLTTAGNKSPFDIYSALLSAQGGRQAIRRYLGPEADDPLDEFLNLALNFPRHGPPVLQHFLNWLGSDEIEIKRELEQSERDEVRLLTVHAAKGLQAPIVVLADTTFTQDGNRDALTWDGDTPIWAAGARVKRDSVSNNLRDQARQQSLREEMRLLYVALTRAEDRLYICGWKQKRTSSGPTWYQQVAGAAEAMVASGGAVSTPFVFEDATGQGFVIGDPPRLSESGTPESPPQARLPEWAGRPAPAEVQPTRPLSPSKPSPLPPAVRSPLSPREADRPFQRGTLLHRLFQFLPGVPVSNRIDVADRVLAEFRLQPLEVEAHVRDVSAILDHPEFSAIFTSDSLAEVPLTGVVNGQVVSGVVDRLLVDQAKVLVVDYKTNRRPPSSPDAVPGAYRTQMTAYVEILRHVYPDRDVKAALLWTEAPRLDTVRIGPAPN